MKRLVIVGGSDAGISAALRAREIDPGLDITVIIADSFPNYSICGLPFFLSGEVSEWQNLAHRTADELEKYKIRLLPGHRATGVDPVAKTVTIVNKSGLKQNIDYDSLIIGTGAVSVRPSFPGADLEGVFSLRWMEDGLAIRRYLKQKEPKSAVILGTGYIGMEMADALSRNGLSVSILARSGRVLKTIDPEFGEIIRKELTLNGVRIFDQVAVTAIERQNEKLVIGNTRGMHIDGDLILIATGARPETSLATDCGIETGIRGAIKVNRCMETNISNIYAAGDCVETWHHILKKYTYLPLGTTAHKQGYVAGENAAGCKAEFAGSSGTQAVKVFDMVIARTGLNEKDAAESGFDPVTSDMETQDHKAYYPGSTPLRIRITGDRKTHRLLGAQMIGNYGAEVSKRIDIFATAIYNRMTVESLRQLDLSYTPPLSSPWDPVQMAAHDWIFKSGC